MFAFLLGDVIHPSEHRGPVLGIGVGDELPVLSSQAELRRPVAVVIFLEQHTLGLFIVYPPL